MKPSIAYPRYSGFFPLLLGLLLLLWIVFVLFAPSSYGAYSATVTVKNNTQYTYRDMEPRILYPATGENSWITAEGGRFTMLPWTERQVTFSHGGAEVGSYFLGLYIQSPVAELHGASWIGDATPIINNELEWVQVAESTAQVGNGATGVNIFTTVVPPGLMVPDYLQKPLWVQEGDTLDAPIYREGVDLIVQAVRSSASSAPTSSGSIFETSLAGDIDLNTFSIDLADTPENASAAITALGTKLQGLIDDPPELTSGSPGGPNKITLHFPALTLLGVSTDEVEIEIDPEPYSTQISIARGLLLALMNIGFFFSVLGMLRSAFADAHTVNYLSNSLKH